MSVRLVILGKQGAGKGTQCVLVSKEFNVPHISTGDVFRAAIKSGSDLGFAVKAVIESGRLVSDEQTNDVIRERLNQDDVADGFLLDGYPRNEFQAGALNEIIQPNSLDLVIELDIPTEEAIARLASRRICNNCGTIYGAHKLPANPLICDVCGGEVIQRDDDRPEAIEKRLALYEEQTAPLRDYYKELNLLATIDGLGTTDEVFSRIVDAIQSRAAVSNGS